jgi:hypothetical protein
VRVLPHPFVFRTTAASMGPAPISIASFETVPLAAGTELSVTVVPRATGLVLSFVLPEGKHPARSNLPGVERLGRWTATYVAVPPDGVVFRASFGNTAPAGLKGFRVLVSTQASAHEGGWPLPSWLPTERTAWTADATWIVDPFALPIAPVPPLR